MAKRPTRIVLRALAVAVLAAAGVGVDAGSRIADEPAPAAQVAPDDAASSPVGEGSDGLALTESDGGVEGRLGSTSVDIVSTQCANGPGSRTRLGLLEHTSIQSYCHGITGPGG